MSERRWKKAPDEEVRPAKTLWDWFQLLIVPAILIGVTFAWSATQTRSDNKREDRRIAADRTAAEIARQDATLQTYLDQISDLMLNKKLQSSKEGDAVRAVARTVTLTTLRRLDRARKGEVLRFLKEASLIDRVRGGSFPGRPQIDLRGADLEDADLRGADLDGVDLRGALLEDADLTSADLHGASLAGANLTHANLTRAFLGKAGFIHANLTGANLTGAYAADAGLAFVRLTRANLTGADLSQAVLQGANLTGANFTRADLRGALLEDADLEGADLTDAKLKGVKGLPKGTP